MITDQPAPATWLAELAAALQSGELDVSAAGLEAHGHDESGQHHARPEAVVYAKTEADIVAVLAFSLQHRLPVTPYAVGSSLEGHAVPMHGGISLDVSRMTRIIEIVPESGYAVVEPGVTYPELNRQARRYGLQFAVDPGAEASLGGMAATGASGTAAVRYGTMHDNVLTLRVALMNGEVIEAGSLARKSSAGYDLKNLFVGSEGTLGVFTRLAVRLHPLPSAVASVQVGFGSVQEATAASLLVLASGLHPERLELVDAESIRAVNRWRGTSLPEGPTLWLELSGRDTADLEGGLTLARELLVESGGALIGEARSEAERSDLWAARHGAFYAIQAMYPGHHGRTTDLCVPIGRLAEAISGTLAILERLDLDAPLLGHVGDGNFHIYLHADPADTRRLVALDTASAEMVALALSLGGTCSGEHGVGASKRGYMRAQHGLALEVMRGIKALFDPHGLLNPGKIFPD